MGRDRPEGIFDFRRGVVTFALVVSSILVTGLKLAFQEPKHIENGEYTENFGTTGAKAASRTRQPIRSTRRSVARKSNSAKNISVEEPVQNTERGENETLTVGAAAKENDEDTNQVLTPLEENTAKVARTRSQRQRRSRLHQNNNSPLACIHEAVPATVEEHESLQVPLATLASIPTLPPRHDKPRSSTEVGIRRNTDSISDASSEGSFSERNQLWAMAEIGGYLQKQSDVFGIWKQRFFRLASFEPHELEMLTPLASEVVKRTTHRCYLLLYWTCDAHTAMTGKQRTNPRGAYLIGDCEVKAGGDSAKRTFVLRNLLNAMDLRTPVPPVHLSASDVRGAHRWMSALSFARLAESLPRVTLDAQERTYPLPDKSETLGVLASPATGEVICSFYFCLYRAHASSVAAAQAAARDEEKDDLMSLPRCLLFSYESEEKAVSRPIVAQSIYDLTKARVTVMDPIPDVLILQGVENCLPFNMHRVNGKLYLKAPSVEAAMEWAQIIDINCRLPQRSQEVPAQIKNTLHERGVDQTASEAQESSKKHIAVLPAVNDENAQYQYGSSHAVHNAVHQHKADQETLVDEIVMDELNLPLPAPVHLSSPTPSDLTSASSELASPTSDISSPTSDLSSPGTSTGNLSSPGSGEFEVDSLSASDILSMQERQYLGIQNYPKVPETEESNNRYYEDDEDDQIDINSQDRDESTAKLGGLKISARHKPRIISDNLQSWQSPRADKLSPVIEEDGMTSPGSTVSRASRASLASRFFR